MRLVVVESPYAGDVERNLRYLDACMADCLRRGESPYASHGLLTRKGVLNDTIQEERKKGMLAGFAWAERADARVFYVDLGESHGMADGRKHAEEIGQPCEFRRLGDGWDAQPDEAA